MSGDEANLILFTGESSRELDQVTIDVLEGNLLREKLHQLADSLIDLINGSQKEKLCERGYVVQLSGPWGAGKTTSTWAVLKKVKQEIEDPKKGTVTLVKDSLLPFGNPNEAMTSFLSGVAYKLWEKKILDVRKEMRQFIVEVTPDLEGHVNLSASLGPFGVSKRLKKEESQSDGKLREKFSRLNAKKHTLILVIDDIDRLRPSEIVDVMRMVEKLRDMPRTIIVVPAFKIILTNAFKQELKLSQRHSTTFLRKLTDGEMNIGSDLQDLKEVFVKSITDSGRDYFGAIASEYGISTPLLVWYMMLHNIVIGEINDIWKTADKLDQNEIAKAFDPFTSQYLGKFKSTLAESLDRTKGKPYFMKAGNVEPPEFAPLGQFFLGIRSNEPESAMREFLNLGGINTIQAPVTVTQELVEIYRTGGPNPQFDERIESEHGKPLFMALLIPLMKESSYEPLLMNNYTFRDIKILANKVIGSHRYVPSGNSFEELYSIVCEAYDEFKHLDQEI